MKKPNLTAEEKLEFSKIEILIMVVLVALVIIAGTTVVSITTRNRKVSNFKEDANYIVNAAKNAYNSFKITNKTNRTVLGSDGITKGTCITIRGLEDNGFLTDQYKSWDGYIVIEEASDVSFRYSAWLTNKKYVINGYDSNKIKDLSIKDGLEKFNDDDLSGKVRTSFTGTTTDKGGLSDSGSLKRYETACINEKID